MPWTGLLAARWSRPVLIGALAAVVLAGASGWIYGRGHSNGYAKRTAEVDAHHAKELANLEAILKEQHQQHIAALQTKLEAEREADRIGDIPRPGIALCDAGQLWRETIKAGSDQANRAAGAGAAAAAATQPPLE